MNADLEAICAKALPVLRHHRVQRAAVFGSTVRGEARPDSDVDIVVELPPEKSLLDLVDLKHDLEQALGRRVDLTEYEALHPLLRSTVEGQQVAVL